ncbi:MAG: DUF924 domain-containing protein [Bdellovibrionales bacterium]|nr:DUF924 domain-containing protein [Bdellovibrionales bacterium]
MQASDVIQFWFEDLQPKQWFTKDNKLDLEIKQKFEDSIKAAKQGELFSWRQSAEGRLAEIIVLDQLTRNAYRGLPECFEADPIAVVLSQEAYFGNHYLQVDESRRSFFFMPLMHSESKAVHELALEVFSMPGYEGTLEYEMKHKAIIDRFGRYPHRNEVLGRESTAEEIEFLGQPGSSF